jgi:hypothetical protein
MFFEGCYFKGVVEDTSIQISITAVLICMMPDLIVYLV